MNTLDALDNITRLALGNAERVDAAIARAEAAEAEVARLRAQLQELRTEYRVACEDFNELLEKTGDW